MTPPEWPAPSPAEPRLLVVIAAHEAVDWHRRCLGSLLAQSFTGWRAVYVDDASTDDTAEHVRAYLAEVGATDRIDVLRSERRLWPARARWLAYSAAEPDEVVCMLDGDDWLAGPDALATVAAAYREGGVECTYGRYLVWNGSIDPNEAPYPDEDIPADVVASGRYRQGEWLSRHLRTARARNLQSIPQADLRDHEGGWLKCSTDRAETWWALEQSGGRHRLLDGALYVYNRLNSERYPTSYYRNETEPRMKRYRERLHEMLERRPLPLSLCMSTPVEALHRVVPTLDAVLRAAAPLDARIEVVIACFGDDAAEDPLRRLIAGRACAARVRGFVSRTPWRPVLADRVTLGLGAGRHIARLGLHDRPSTADLKRLMHDPPTTAADALRSAVGVATSRHRLHALLWSTRDPAAHGDGPYLGGRWVRPITNIRECHER